MRKSIYETGPAGDAASAEGLARFSAELTNIKATKAALLHLRRGLKYAGADQFDRAEKAAMEAAALDPKLFYAWHLMGIARDKLNNRAGALEAYEKALALSPESPAIANDLGRLAYRMEMWPQAEALFRHCLAFKPGAPEASNNLGALLRTQMRYDEAIEVLKTSLLAHPREGMVWITLGTVLSDAGRFDEAVTFYEEALRLNPRDPKAHYNLSGVQFAIGQEEAAITRCLNAFPLAKQPLDGTMMRFSVGVMSLGSGDLTQGWKYYGARLEPSFNEPIHYYAKSERWTPETDIRGRHLMLFGEQGLGDEILFANVLDTVLEDLGPEGKLTMAVTDRLVSYFQRSFPDVEFSAHVTMSKEGSAHRFAPAIKDWSGIDYWAPMADMLSKYRPSVDSFPNRPQGFMKPDPERVEYWRGVLSALPGAKIGLLWTSLIINSTRHLYFSPFEDWAPVLTTPGVTFVNLQYGDRSADLEFVRERFGVEIYQPEGIDLKNDLDEVAALSAALDLVVGVSNATFNIAAAAGAPAWLISTPRVWTWLGTDRYPWYSQVKAFARGKERDWTGVMAQVAQALGEHLGHGTRLAATG
ncbi:MULTISPECIES: tetratricopeptide repeat protein [Phenylobacterium]|uniref:Tetratricopeptide (TPR) repeat protein n=1 Tax=Phenylobacterium koreense TaxID=266125 RepID=A0ABV2ED06_9CAUL